MREGGNVYVYPSEFLCVLEKSGKDQVLLIMAGIILCVTETRDENF